MKETKYSLALIEKMSPQEIERIIWIETASQDNPEARVLEAMVKRLLDVIEDKGWS